MQSPQITPANTALATPHVRSITLLQPLQWLALAWRDMARCGWISIAHGLVLALLGWAILLLAHDKFWLLAGAFSGFLVIAPVLATSLYALSRDLVDVSDLHERSSSPHNPSTSANQKASR